MHYHVLTLFPDMIEHAMGHSIMGRALENGLLDMEVISIRDFSENKYNKVDDYPYGGGAGMVMQPEPVFRAYEKVKENVEKQGRIGKPKVIYMTPQGKVFNQKMADNFAKEEDLVILCGHYEGIDERVLEEIVDENISIGDYVLTGGELPALVVMDSIARLLPGVLHNEESAKGESFSDNLLEYPQYTRPAMWHGKQVPDILMSGHHANIEAWRKKQSLARTKERRPDLLSRDCR